MANTYICHAKSADAHFLPCSIYLSIHSNLSLSSSKHLPISLYLLSIIYLNFIYQLSIYLIFLSPNHFLLKHNIQEESHVFCNCTPVEFSQKELSHANQHHTWTDPFPASPLCLLLIYLSSSPPLERNHYPESNSIAWFVNFHSLCKCSLTIHTLCVVFILHLLF